MGQKIDLLEWAVSYYKHKDIMEHDIQNIQKEDRKATITYSDKARHLFAFDNLSDELLSKLPDKDIATLVCLNTQANVKFLIENWKVICQKKGLCMIFLNTKTDRPEKWLIKPYVHNQITEKASLKTGIRTLAENAGYI